MVNKDGYGRILNRNGVPVSHIVMANPIDASTAVATAGCGLPSNLTTDDIAEHNRALLSLVITAITSTLPVGGLVEVGYVRPTCVSRETGLVHSEGAVYYFGGVRLPLTADGDRWVYGTRVFVHRPCVYRRGAVELLLRLL